MSKSEAVNPKVKLETNQGDIIVELYPEKSPITVDNFLNYVSTNFYDNTIFHRVIGNFMIQGGGFTPEMEQKETREPIKNEANNGLSNKRGTIAMARTQIVDSATCQFFINVVDNNFLDFKNDSPQGYGYCVFGQVIEGIDTVDKIREVETTSHGYFNDVPAEPVIILSIRKI